MDRSPRVAVAIAVLAVGALFSLYGLFAILYQGDSGGGDTYVKWAGHTIDAYLAGAVALVVGVMLLVVSVLLLKRNRRSPLGSAGGESGG